MKLFQKIFAGLTILLMLLLAVSNASAFFGSKFETVKAENGKVYIPVKKVNDGKAHYFKAKAADGIMVEFFLVQSMDGVIRAAVDSCDVCYKSGKGYVKEGNVMVCTNCGRRFATDRVNEVKGGCNPAPLKRVVEGENLVISMQDINANAWLCKYK